MGAKQAGSLNEAGPAKDLVAKLPARRIYTADLVRAYDEAEAMVAEARRQAETTLNEARQQAVAVRLEAERQGHEEGMAAGAAALTAAWLRLRNEEARTLREQERHIVTVGGLFAERLLGRALELDPSLMVALAREALKAFVRARRVCLYVHPADVEALQKHLGELGLEATTIDVRADPSRPRGGLRAESDIGTIDADYALQIDRLVAALRDVRAQGP
jgi:type III secretion protein L